MLRAIVADDDSGQTLDKNAYQMALQDRPVAQQYLLEVVEGPIAGETHLESGTRCSVGSHPSNGFVIDDRAVSRFHFEVWLDERGARIRDLESRNGTTVDGVDVLDARLRDGSLIRVGDSTVRFRLAETSTPLPVSTKDQFGLLVGASLPMRAAFYLLERAAASDATVLLQGDTGTGKDAAAESIHLESRRRDAPLVVLDCGSIPKNLIESELFGHEKGAFTGAVTQRAGVFESANGGTIFLDELGELPGDLQPKLLRVLEQRAIQRVGGNKRIPVDVRVIAATNVDLRNAVNDGGFRPDLYYRLAVIKIHMPALRERPEDIPRLVEVILDSLGTSAEERAKLVTPDFLSHIQRAAWPGNVRELRNYLEQCVVLLQPPPLPLPHGQPSPLTIDVRIPFHTAKRRLLEEFERRYLLDLLAAHEGNVSRAARAGGLDRTHLHRLRRRLSV